MILDATRGSIARFVNHSCEPNCKIIKWTVEGQPRMALFAGDEGIMTGEELTYDYNFESNNKENVTICRCGAPSCRGVLGPKTKEPKDALKPLVKNKRTAGEMLGDVADMARDVASNLKRRKINVPKSAKALLGKGGKDASPNPKKGGKPKKEEKPLPIGWIYPEEAQPFKSINEGVDPEAILRHKRRKAKMLATVREENVDVVVDDDDDKTAKRRGGGKTVGAKQRAKNIPISIIGSIKKGAKAIAGAADDDLGPE